MGAFRTDMPRLMWLCMLVTFLLVVADLGSAEKKKVDSDLSFDSKLHKNSIDLKNHHHTVRRRQERHIKANPEQDHWFFSTLTRLKRNIDNFLGRSKAVSTSKSHKKHVRRKQLGKRQTDYTTESGDDFDHDDDDEALDEGEGEDEEYKEADEDEDGDDEDDYEGVLTLENQTPEVSTTTQSSLFGGPWFTLKPSWLTLQPSITENPDQQQIISDLEDTSEISKTTSVERIEQPSSTTEGDTNIFGGNWFTLKPSWLTLQSGNVETPSSITTAITTTTTTDSSESGFSWLNPKKEMEHYVSKSDSKNSSREPSPIQIQQPNLFNWFTDTIGSTEPSNTQQQQQSIEDLPGSNEVEVFSETTPAPSYFDGGASWFGGNPWFSISNTTVIEGDDSKTTTTEEPTTTETKEVSKSFAEDFFNFWSSDPTTTTATTPVLNVRPDNENKLSTTTPSVPSETTQTLETIEITTSNNRNAGPNNEETTTERKRPSYSDDDEDYLYGSGDKSSGDGEWETSTPEVTSAVKPADVKGYYRITLVVREPFINAYNDRNNYQYNEFSDHIKSAIEDVYEDTHGISSLSVISIQKRPSDPFTSRVILDLGISTPPTADDQLKDTLLNHIRKNRRIGRYEALPDEFNFFKFDVLRTCQEYELPCKSGGCFDVKSRCDGISDCSDRTDEEGCETPEISTTTSTTTSTTITPTTTISTTTEPPTTTGSTTTSTDSTLEGSGEGNCRADDAQPCADGSLIICSDQICDGVKDCHDGGDEKNCQPDCTSGEFSCDLTRCIQAKQRCDGTPDCHDQTDEQECSTCNGDAFHCDGSKCLQPSKKCDRVRDCLDGTDEDNCIEESRCVPGQFECSDGRCINDYQKCDKRIDCPNGEDEQSCPAGCSSAEFACGDGKCIPLAAKCDRKYDCRDRSDEKKCPCLQDDFHCANGFCIPPHQRCDGIHNCQDGSDENNCASLKPCSSNEWRCSNGMCIRKTNRCNSVRDCTDNSDEIGCEECRIDEFRCENGSCINLSQRCDGKADCSSAEDEASCARCAQNEFTCADGSCIPDYLKCSGQNECSDGSDEKDCPSCRDDEFQCENNQCIPRGRECDSVRDCSDGSDEYNCQPKRCSSSEFTCGDGSCIPIYLQCDGRPDCRDETDERECRCTSDQFLCENGQCINGSLRCNSRRDCSDGSDENNCPTETPPPPTEQPPTIPSRCPSGYFQCRSGNQCVPNSQVCDGPADCNDMSDETDCAGLDLKTYPPSQSIRENREVVFQCRDEGPMRAPVRWTRPNGLPLPPGSKDNRGRLEMPNIKVEHSGDYICEAVGFPSTAKNAQVRVQLTVERSPTQPTRPSTACALTEATCSNGDCIPKEAVCDGQRDCTDGSDELRCKPNGCEPNEFRCANTQCVLKTWRCDGDDDCSDGSDETGCVPNPPGSMCSYHHFACHSNNQCIPKSYQCDLERDCVDGSDEIGCSAPVTSRGPPPMVTLSVGELFEITCTAVGVPVPIINWRRNWGHVPAKCRMSSVDGVGTLTCPDIQPEDQGAYSCESINIKGATFYNPDTILVVKTENVCRPGYFNSDARSEAECIKCFCFGHGGQCRSADLFIYHYQPPFDTLKLLGVRVDPITGAVEIRDEPIYRNAVPQLTSVGLQGVNSYLPNADLTQPNLVPYFAMPENYHGNQLKSYGGYLRYTVNHGNRGYGVPGPDVILTGNNYILLHQSRQAPESYRDDNRAVRFFEGEWLIKSGNAPERVATREEIMMSLANIDNLLIKLQYNEGPLNTTLSNIVMESAAVPDNNLGAASYVEECSCPVGYSGLSCERCDDGYERQSTGPWLGQCYKAKQECPPGTFGDLERGIECQTCPCPLTNPSNQFGRTCYLGPDGDAVCDCPLGYSGKRCEQCSAGYEGDPTIPGDSCRPRPQELCNRAGSREVSPKDGKCNCKDNVDGPTCSQCKVKTFDLSIDNQFGCVSCFCMGVSSQCVSSTLYRDQISSAFTSSVNGFSIIDIDDRNTPITDDIRLDSQTRQILYSSFPSQNVFYWSLPPRYLGNKLTSYGGFLRYTLKHVPLPGGQSSRNSAADVQLISKNHIDLLYYAKEQNTPSNTAQSFVVPLLEQYWQRSDGQVADREHFLMALADLQSILIKATYTTNTMEAALVSVSLDTANVRNTGSPERASAVEQCYCPEGYKGSSCEDCAPGYTRGVNGLYLGVCEPCSCNGHSNECNPENGACINCRDHTTGRYCEKCLPGYDGDPQKGIPCRYREGTCQCDPRGSLSNDCHNGVCSCKQNVQGNLCDRCRSGTFGLSSSNNEGCQTCFCSGVASECSESDLFVEQIPTQILDENSHGFSLTDQNLQKRISDNFQFNFAINEISYTFGPGESRLYWSMPHLLTGNQIRSYGGKLEFRQRFNEYGRGRPIQDQDVIIVGDKLTIFWTNSVPLVPDVQNKVSVTLDTSQGWQRLDQYAGPRPASREDIMIALSNVKEILIRAQPSDTTQSSSISDVTLDTAIEANTAKGTATSVETCRCPVGYEGSSCESCVVGYYKDVKDTTAGPLGSCIRCPCTENARGCSMGPDNYVICQCDQGYTGSRCENFGEPNNTDTGGSTNRPPVTINVTITAPNIRIFEIGSTLRLNCSAISYRTQTPAMIHWSKDGGPLPETAIDDGTGILIITNLRVSDSGRYICEAEDGYSIVSKDITVTVGTSAPVRPRVVVNNPYVDVKEGQRIEVQCAASGNPTPNFILQRADNQLLNPRHYFENGLFRIEEARLSDAGRYNCIAENLYGSDTASFDVDVRVSAGDITRVIIEPPSIRVSSGQSFTLRCMTQNNEIVRWSKENGQLPYNARQEGSFLIVPSASRQDSGTYICTLTDASGATGRSSASVEITESGGEFPTVRVSPETVSITQGSSTELRCDGYGSPIPTIQWTRADRGMTSHAEQIGSILYIRNADESDAGTYVCVAVNSRGMEQAHVTVSVTRGMVPIVRIYPNATQNIIEGHSLELECSTEGGTSARVEWRRRNGLPLGRDVEQVQYPQRGILRFNRILKSDEGEYICTAQNDAGTVSALANIYVQSPPQIRIEPDEKVFYRRVGEPLTIRCSAGGVPAPAVSWTRYPVPLSSSEVPSAIGEDYALLQFRQLSRSDEGFYICQATSNSGTSRSQIQLFVDSLPTRGDITGEDATSENGYKDLVPSGNEKDVNKYTAPEGTQAELRCSIASLNNGLEQVDTKWVRANNAPLPENAFVRGGTLYIDNVQESAKGLYSCLGTRRSTGQLLFTLNAYLDVISPPKITLEPKRQVVQPGANAYIQCSATGQQPITIRWSPMGREFPTSVNVRNGLLQFNNIKLSDAGRYRCTAVNSAGEADAVADVFVQETRYHPSISAVDKSPVAPIGSSVTLQCHIENSTNADIHWSKDNAELPQNSYITPDKNLLISNAQLSNEGRYYCEIPGYTRDFVDLRVTVSPPEINKPMLNISPPEKKYRIGEDIDIHCQSNQPGAITTWSKPSGWLDDNVQSIGGTLRILKLKRENAGTYRCEAQGYQGVYHKDYNLQVIENNSESHADVETKIAPKGSGVVLECRTNLQEPITYVWSKAGGELPRYIDPNSKTIQLNDLSSSDAGAYMCSARDPYRTVEVPVILVITGIVPYFSQAPSSYIALPTLMDPYIQFSFEISFKPERSNGLILYNGNKLGERGGDFISLSIMEGSPVFKYNLGYSVTTVKSSPISIGQWHTVKIVRNRKKVTMYVDGQGPQTAVADGKFIGLDLRENLYLGGVPRFDRISPEVEMDTGFVGCISRFKMGHSVQDIVRDALEKEGVTNCETCSENRCQNRGVCQESLTNEGYVCICHSGFSGATCNKLKGEACSPYSCGTGRCIDNEEGFECMCPMGKTGQRCESEIQIEQPAFDKNAFIAYSVPKQRRLKYSMKFKPNSIDDGVLLYCGETEEGYGDFASLSLKDQHVEFRFDVGNGPTVIRSPRKIGVGDWVAVTASRSLSEGRLIVSGDAPVIERSPGNNKTPNLLTYLYVGGVDKQKVRVNEGVGVSSGFEGCISDVNIGGTEMHMTQSAVDSSNVLDCSSVIHESHDMNNNLINNERSSPTPYNHHETGCTSSPCRNDGLCMPLSPTQYRCNCVNGYSGNDCEIAPNQCDYLKPCQNNGGCRGNTTNYSCDCSLGYTGTNCEQRAELKSDAHFDGNGYLEFSRDMLSHQSDSEEEVIALELSTNSSNGLILWHGQPPNSDAQGQDYLALSLENGNLQFSYDLGSGPAIIYNNEVRVNDGERHLVILKRRGKTGSIEIDRQFTQSDTSIGSATSLNCRGNIYLGGAPDINFMTANRYRNGFTGCIHNFELQESQQIDLGRRAISGLNVKACSSYEGIYSYDDHEDDNLTN